MSSLLAQPFDYNAVVVLSTELEAEELLHESCPHASSLPPLPGQPGSGDGL